MKKSTSTNQQYSVHQLKKAQSLISNDSENLFGDIEDGSAMARPIQQQVQAAVTPDTQKLGKLVDHANSVDKAEEMEKDMEDHKMDNGDCNLQKKQSLIQTEVVKP